VQGCSYSGGSWYRSYSARAASCYGDKVSVDPQKSINTFTAAIARLLEAFQSTYVAEGEDSEADVLKRREGKVLSVGDVGIEFTLSVVKQFSTDLSILGNATA